MQIILAFLKEHAVVIVFALYFFSQGLLYTKKNEYLLILKRVTGAKKKRYRIARVYTKGLHYSLFAIKSTIEKVGKVEFEASSFTMATDVVCIEYCVKYPEELSVVVSNLVKRGPLDAAIKNFIEMWCRSFAILNHHEEDLRNGDASFFVNHLSEINNLIAKALMTYGLPEVYANGAITLTKISRQ